MVRGSSEPMQTGGAVSAVACDGGGQADSPRRVIAAQHSTEALGLDDIAGGGAVALLGRDQLIAESLVRPFQMEVGSVVAKSTPE